MEIGSLKDYKCSVSEAGFLQSLAKGLGTVAKGIGDAIVESDGYMLKNALREAKRDGRYYDVKFIKQLLDMNKNVDKGKEPGDEGMYYLLKKAYLDQPREIKRLKASNKTNKFRNENNPNYGGRYNR